MHKNVLIALALVLLALAVSITHNPYYLHVIAITVIWTMFAIGWNIFSGFGGFVSFGHAIFFGTGAYATVLLETYDGVTPLLGIPIGVVLSLACAAAIGFLTFRLRGHFFSLAMLSFPVCAMYLTAWAGYQELPIPIATSAPALHVQFERPEILPLICIATCAIAALISVLIEQSRLGLALHGIRQNEAAAEVSGISVFRTRMIALLISAAMSAVAGGLYAVAVLVVTPDNSFGMLVSAQALIIAMFGGLTTTAGPVIGGIILIPLTELLHAHLGDLLPGIQGVSLGAALIVIVSLLPRGLVVTLTDRFLRARLPHASSDKLTDDHSPRSAIFSPRLSANRTGPVLSAERLEVNFGGMRAIRNVDFHVRFGEIVGVIGPNGAGKTTLFNAINGFVVASGAVSLNGQRLGKVRPDRLARLGMGRTFQTARPFPEMNVWENVYIGATSFTASAREAAAATERALEATGIAAVKHRRADVLTNKELRLVELARAIASGPLLLLLDEPFAGLSKTEIKQMCVVLKDLRTKGLSIAIIDHNVPAIRELVDRLVVLDHGEVVIEGDAEEVLRHEAVIGAYLGSADEDANPSLVAGLAHA